MNDNTKMEFYVDHEVLEFIDHELISLRDSASVLSAVVFVTSEGTRRQLSSFDDDERKRDCGRLRRLKLVAGAIVIEFEVPGSVPDQALEDLLFRTADHIRVVLELSLQLHLERERSPRGRGRGRGHTPQNRDRHDSSY